jgi:NAD(P)-dependent dehydrogenase (short-subunit alcohol dehydrogenase family)
MVDLSGRIALVTGAASGLGAASARCLALYGARVLCVDIDGEGVERTAAAIRSAGQQAAAFTADVSRPEDNDAMATAAVDAFGGLHLVHLNAGIQVIASVVESTVEEWDSVLNVNLRGTFLGLRACSRRIIESRGGAMVLTSSATGLMGIAGGAAYTASKHGILGLMKSAAADLAPYGIRVNGICPGIIDTPMFGPLHGQTDILTKYFGVSTAIGRVGSPEEVAQVVAFLLSDQASYITATTLPIDGGLVSVQTAMTNGVNELEPATVG